MIWRLMKKLLLNLLVILFIFTGCSSLKQESTSQNKIVIGIDDFKPYSYIGSDGQYTGIDVELARQCFNRLGYEVEFVVIDWAKKNDLLNNGDIDCIWSCYSMNGRGDKYEWAGPYLYSRQVVLVRQDSDIYTLADLKDKRMGVQATTKGEEIALGKIESEIGDLKQVNTFATTNEMFSAIRKDYVNAICGHEGLLNSLVSDSGFRILDESVSTSSLGVAFKKDSHKELVQALNNTLKEIRDDGTLESIVSKYGFDAGKVIIYE